ncbi:MAG: anthranilate synthase component I, partial [Chloroflexi bacterium]|nr:anthranilate synthase component I [Chloroflexota bacterium]
MYSPTLEQVEQYSKSANLVPIYREINADLETPVSAYLKIARPPYSFLLESVEGGEHIARYSFIGTEPTKVFKTGEGEEYGAVDPLKPIEEELSQYTMADVPAPERFNGGAVGYLTYDAVRYFEKLPTPDDDPIGVPESVFMLTSTYLIFDHLRHKIKVVSHAHLNGDVERAYADAVQRIDDIVARLDEPVKVPVSDDASHVK